MPTQTALLLIDIQNGFLPQNHPPNFWGPSRSNPLFEQNVTTLLSRYRSLVSLSPSQHKIIHVAHSSRGEDSPLHASKPGFAFQEFAQPKDGETVLVKSVNSAFIGTDLEEILKDHFSARAGEKETREVEGKLYIVGLTTDHCVSTTVRMAGNLGVCGQEGEVVLVEDGTAAHGKGGWDAETVHAVHAESLREFAGVRGTEEVLDEWKGL